MQPRSRNDDEALEAESLLGERAQPRGWARLAATGAAGLSLLALAAAVHSRSPSAWKFTPEVTRSFMQAQQYGSSAYGTQAYGAGGYEGQGYAAQQAFPMQQEYPAQAVAPADPYSPAAQAAGYGLQAAPAQAAATQYLPAAAAAAAPFQPAVPPAAVPAAAADYGQQGYGAQQAFPMQQEYPVPPAAAAAPAASFAAPAARTCVDLPGVRLKGGSRAPGEQAITSDAHCRDWCRDHAECKQSVWSWDTKTCELFTEARAEAQQFKETWPWFNSSYCDTSDKQGAMMDMLQQVYDTKAWVPPAQNCSWAGDNCIDTRCCADVCKADYNFETCEYFTCWKRDEYWAGCKSGPAPEGWDGANLGGHANTEVEPAPAGKLVQGTRLYCFSVVMWSLGPAQGWEDSEGDLANHWKEQGKGIMQCDFHAFFDGLDGGSEHNIQSFINAWKMVKDDGRWKQADWTIKVDADAVFFPAHFKVKVETVYRTPQGAALYLRNTFYKFQFLGALEAITREGIELYFQRGWECEPHLTQEGGEDYWLLQCLEGIGLNYQTDTALLHDKYAADENCGDPDGVAHHFFKKIDDWDVCWNMANEAWNSAHPE